MPGHTKLFPRISTITRKRYWNTTHQAYRGFAAKNVDDFNYSRNEYMLEGRDARDEEIAMYPRVTAQDLASYKLPPQGVKMLVRDFIQDSLYNPNYGYFSKRAEIFSPVEPITFNEIREAAEFDATVARMYREYDVDTDLRDVTGRQVWHTPTELFKVSDINFCDLQTFINAAYSHGMDRLLLNAWFRNIS
jgi:hypothetical protein